MATEGSFTKVDYAVFGITISLSVIIGIGSSIWGAKDKNTGDYLVGSRRLAVFPVAVSLLMSGVSAVELLGTTAEMYYFGTQASLDTLGRLLVYPIPIFLIVPLIHGLKVTSIFEYFQLRYDSTALHVFSVLVFVGSSLLNNAVNLYAPSTAFEAVTGISYKYCVGLSGVLVTLYTAVGGLRGVVWADLFQGMVLIGGLIVVLVAGSQEVGGIAEVWRISDEGQRIKFFDFNPDPTERMTFWTAVIGGASWSIMFGALGQTAVQRYSAVSSAKKGMWMYAINIPTSILIEAIICLTGLTVYAYYAGCDPTMAGKIQNPNQILPYFMVDVLDKPGLPGLFIAVVFCACLSTNSTFLNGASAILYKCFFESLLNRCGVKESRRVWFIKCLVVVYGLSATGVAYGIPHLDGHVVQLMSGIFGGMVGPLSGATFLGMLVPFAQWKGALGGTVLGVAFTTWINIGKQLGDDVRPHLSPLEYNATECDPFQPPGMPNNSLLEPTTSLYDTFSATQTQQADASFNTTIAPGRDPSGGGSEMFVLYRISFMYMAAIGFLVTFITGIILSLLTGPANPGEPDRRTMVNWSKTIFFRYLSPQRRSKLMCGYDLPDESDEELEDSVTEKKELEKIPPEQVCGNNNDWFQGTENSEKVNGLNGIDNNSMTIMNGNSKADRYITRL